jgi:hypothetical protein
MSAEYRSEISANGYKLPILKSGLQKYIRRGNTYKALYCAGELDLFKNINGGERIRTNFFNRLIVILLEDICNIDLIEELYPIIKSIINNRQDIAIESKLHYVISKMCLSTKARICSHVRALFNPQNKSLLELFNVDTSGAFTEAFTGAFTEAFTGAFTETLIEDEAKAEPPEASTNEDITISGALEEFQTLLEAKNILCIKYGLFLNSAEGMLKNAYKRSRRPVYGIFKILAKYTNIDAMLDLHKNHIGKLKEGFLCWMVPTLRYIGIIEGSQVPDPGEEINLNWVDNRAKIKIEIDDYVHDIHTGNRSADHIEFAIRGALVDKEAAWINKSWKNVYTYSKYLAENKPECIPGYMAATAPRETDYNFLVRTQLVTSRAKMDVYLAEKGNNLYVVKGPYNNTNGLKALKRITDVKKTNRISFISFSIKKMIPDRWEATPLGNRNSIDTSKPQYFIIFKSIIGKDQISTKLHKSKLWPETEVVDWDKCPIHLDFNKRELSCSEMRQYIDMVVFRYILGIPDLADRNFLRFNKKIVSIDEDILGRDVNLKTELKKTKCKKLSEWLAVEGNFEKLAYPSWVIDQDLLVKNIPSKAELMGLLGE